LFVFVAAVRANLRLKSGCADETGDVKTK